MTNFINFEEIGYSKGDEFDILVYAEQFEKLGFVHKYDIESGEIEDFESLNNCFIDGEKEYVTKKFNPSIATN